MASKRVLVKEHYRLIFTRTYKFMCAECSQPTDRETFAVKQPKYCTNCRPPKPKRESNGNGIGTGTGTGSRERESENSFDEFSGDVQNGSLSDSSPTLEPSV